MSQKPMNTQVMVALLAIMVIFVIHAQSLDFTQDDAFISFRYVENFLDGRGLVFNPGERVEGYTNFLWIMLLSLFASLGLDVILISKLLGVASGCASLFLLYKISTFVFLKEDGSTGLAGSSKSHAASQSQKVMAPGRLFALAPPLLLALNGSFAYWSISGLETTFFTMAVLMAVYFYLTNEKLMVVSAALSSLIRPEGALVFAILMAHKLLLKRDRLRTCLLYILAFAALLAPFAIFKISYYGDLLPNPFYAKTGFSAEYWRVGLAYWGLFLRHYGLWGVLYVIPAVFFKKLEVKGKLLVLFIYLYTLCIIMVGGDVLQGHRFFQPIIPFLYLLFVFALLEICGKLKRGPVNKAIPILLLATVAALSFFLPRAWLLNIRRLETGLCLKMVNKARMLRESFGKDYTLATTTIGAISYHTGARVIDMLGLTDPYIAKHPEKIPGIVSTWKEKRFNTQYLLSQDPDVIMFSTGKKPSAPAEKALLMSSKFRENYYHYYFPDRVLWNVFKRKGDCPNQNKIFPDARFVELYIEAMVADKNGDLETCLDKLEQVLVVGPPNFSWVYDHMAYCHYMLGNVPQAKESALKAIALDDHSILSHNLLRQIYRSEGDTAAVLREQEKLLLYNPEMKIKR